MAKRKSYLKRVRTDSVAAVDEEGVMTTAQNPVYVKVTGDGNYTQWLHNLSPIIKLLKHTSDIKLLYWIGQKIEYDEGIICLNKVYKKRCQKEMDIGESSLEKSLAVLKKYEIIVSHEDSKRSAIFRVNPAYIWRGGSAERDKNERQWLERMRINNLPDKEKGQQKLIKKSKGYRYDFSKIKAAR